MSEETYILSQEFDNEKALRILGDSRLADYVGKNLDVDGNPDDQPPKYSDYGITIDVPDGTDLTHGINILDRLKQGNIQWQNPLTVATGPIFARFDQYFELTAFINGVDITFIGVAGGDLLTFAGPNAPYVELPQDYFGTMLGFSTTNVGAILSVKTVVTKVFLYGRKVTINPAP